jgi:GntR family transcriptional regulator
VSSATTGERGAAGDTVRLDRSSFVPLYYQLQEVLKQQIESGLWPPGSPLPGEQSLGRQFGVSRVVVRQALSILADDRQIRRVRGVGTFVAEPKRESRAGGLCRLLEHVRDGAVEVSILQKGVVRVEESIRSRLRIADDQALGVAFSLSLAGDTVAIGHSYFPRANSAWIEGVAVPGVTLPASADLATIRLGRSEISIEGSHCDRFEADIFGIEPREPVFLVHSLDFRKSGNGERPLEFARVVYRSDVLQFRFELEPAGDHQTLSALWSLNPQ